MFQVWISTLSHHEFSRKKLNFNDWSQWLSQSSNILKSKGFKVQNHILYASGLKKIRVQFPPICYATPVFYFSMFRGPAPNVVVEGSKNSLCSPRELWIDYKIMEAITILFYSGPKILKSHREIFRNYLWNPQILWFLF